MKLALNFLFVAVVALTWSCGTITEEISINEDGSGEYKAYSDLIPSMKKMTLGMVKMFAETDSVKKNMSEEELLKSLEDEIWKDFPDEVDSTFTNDDMVPDSIKNDPAKKKILDKMVGFMQGGKSKGYMNVGISYKFSDFKDLEEFLKILETSQKKKSGLNENMADFARAETEVDYTFSKGKFSRKTKILNKPDIEESQMSMIQMMMGDSKIKTIIHLPKNVKKVKGDNIIENKGKTVVFEHSLMDMVMGKSNSDFEITLKK